MELNTHNKCILTFGDLKRQFPGIKGDLIELEIDYKNNTVIVDTKTAYYEDEKVVIHKELVTTTKDNFVVVDKATNTSAEGLTEADARKNLEDKLKLLKKE